MCWVHDGESYSDNPIVTEVLSHVWSTVARPFEPDISELISIAVVLAQSASHNAYPLENVKKFAQQLKYSILARNVHIMIKNIVSYRIIMSRL